MSSSSGELRSASCVRQDSQIAPATASFGQFWAGFGALMFVIEGYFLVKWISGPNWKPVDPGPNIAPAWMLSAAFWVQVILVVGFFPLLLRLAAAALASRTKGHQRWPALHRLCHRVAVGHAVELRAKLVCL